MASPKLPKPTDAELAILAVLWEQGPSTVRQIQEVMDRARPTGYTTVLKLLQIMTDKGLVQRDERERSHVYRPRLSQDQTQRQLLGDLLDRAFAGSTARLVMQALSSRKASAEELAAIRKLLDDWQEGGDR
ncbi:MAG: BlaI/MecI/CopY family transcriptional regulator [Bacteroidales bacterium]